MMAADVPNGTLRQFRRDALNLRSKLDQVLSVAHQRLTPPLAASQQYQQHPGTDWAWRHEYWSTPAPSPGQAYGDNQARIADNMVVFHDCPLGQISFRQHRNNRQKDITPYGLDLDVLAFKGTFLSIVVDLPQSVIENLRKTHVIRMNFMRDFEHPSDIFARLNVKYGPNTEQIVREIPADTSYTSIEFDLAYTQMMEKRMEKMWVDLIIDQPAMNHLRLHELSFSRHPRAEL